MPFSLCRSLYFPPSLLPSFRADYLADIVATPSLLFRQLLVGFSAVILINTADIFSPMPVIDPNQGIIATFHSSPRLSLQWLLHRAASSASDIKAPPLFANGG
jgi:hypothetical protein